MQTRWIFPVFLLLGGCFWGGRPQPVVAVPTAVVPAATLSVPVVHDPPLAVMAVAEPVAAETSKVVVQCETLPAGDAEALEDTLILVRADQTSPDDEGETVRADEVTFDFPVVENEKVRHRVDYYTGPARGAFTRWLQRSERYLPMMRKIFAEEGLPQDLAYLAMVESGFNTKAYSWAHAVGPWQFIESTGKAYGLKSDWWRDERRDFEKSTRAAARFLRDLHKRFNGDWYLAVAAYNAGGGKISKATKMYQTRDFWKLTHGKYLQPETKNYIPKFLAVLIVAKDQEKHGFVDLDCLKPLQYDVVSVPTVTDLDLVARLCGVSYEEIKGLNPELKRWCTPPGVKDYQLRIPKGRRAEFEMAYARVPEDRRANYKHHKIRKGDTLRGLAKKYNIRVDDIIDLNKIKDPRTLRIGKDLILPLHASYSRLPVDEMQDDYIRTRRRTYKVRKGDSLWTIGRRFDVTEKQLRVWNRLGWSNTIRPGQTLVVSAKGAKSVKPKQKAASSKGSVKKTVYSVRSGDTLWGIGRKYDVSTESIRSWNNLSKNHVLRPGQTLVLSARGAQPSRPQQKAEREKGPVKKILYSVRAGDTLWDIGRKYDVSTGSIRSWNNLPQNHVLRPGDKLTLMVHQEYRG